MATQIPLPYIILPLCVCVTVVMWGVHVYVSMLVEPIGNILSICDKTSILPRFIVHRECVKFVVKGMA